MTAWVITQIQYVCKPLCCLLLLVCLPGKAKSLAWHEHPTPSSFYQHWSNEWTRCHFNRGRNKMKQFVSHWLREKGGRLAGKTLVSFSVLFPRMGSLCRCLSLELPPSSSPSLYPCGTKVCAGCFNYAQLWTDGWHSTDQYVRSDGEYKEILTFCRVVYPASKCIKALKPPRLWHQSQFWKQFTILKTISYLVKSSVFYYGAVYLLQLYWHCLFQAEYPVMIAHNLMSRNNKIC